tara:strand:- start:1597 stop:2076 length:480 start_codon:yes stop_codon:yes gene_type:complete
MMGITTNIRRAVTNDVPHIMALAEIEYNLFDQPTAFSPDICEKYIHMMMLDPDGMLMVIEDRSRIPFGYLTGGIDFVDLSSEPTAVAQHWFVHNPNQQYGKKNYGLELLSAFEGWAKQKKCSKLSVGIRMNLGQKRSYDRTFDSIGYKPNYVYYSKEIK